PRPSRRRPPSQNEKPTASRHRSARQNQRSTENHRKRATRSRRSSTRHTRSTTRRSRTNRSHQTHPSLTVVTSFPSNSWLRIGTDKMEIAEARPRPVWTQKSRQHQKLSPKRRLAHPQKLTR